MKITFLGATQEVTGSRYLVEHQNTKVLVDCGLYQEAGLEQNQSMYALPVQPHDINAIVLTHAHVDHTGYIPRLVKDGFKGAIYCSQGTLALCSILLIDSGKLYELNAQRSLQRFDAPPITPLYNKSDAEYALSFFKVVEYENPFMIGSLEVILIGSSHILGSAFVVISDGKKTITFSGDLGRQDDIIMKAPPYLEKTNYLVLESTYGDRLHEHADPIMQLQENILKTIAKKGVLIIPSFAVGRTQALLYCLYELKKKNRIPDVPIFLDSPMAIAVTQLFCDFSEEYRMPLSLCKKMAKIAHSTVSMKESQDIYNATPPYIIIAGSGMADGGRVVQHIKHFIADKKNTILFVGFQAQGTLGRLLIQGAQEVEIEGVPFSVRAEVKHFDTLSAHADFEGILDWLSHFKEFPEKIFITHGEAEAAFALKKRIEEQFAAEVIVPKFKEAYDLI